jgi:hypothetical protein
VFATADCGTGLSNGLSLHLRRGQVWAADDPLVIEKEGQGLFSDEPPELCRTTPDPARLEAALATAGLAQEIAEADRDRPTSTLIRY